MVTISQYILILNHYVVLPKLIYCYMSSIFQFFLKKEISSCVYFTQILKNIKLTDMKRYRILELSSSKRKKLIWECVVSELNAWGKWSAEYQVQSVLLCSLASDKQRAGPGLCVSEMSPALVPTPSLHVRVSKDEKTEFLPQATV